MREPSPIERYVQQANDHALEGNAVSASAGSLYRSGSPLAEIARDQRAYQLDDLVTIVVAEKASAIARGSTTAARKSQSKSGITALAGALPATSPLANLATLGGESKLDGQGETTRSTELTTTLAARVIHVMPNGNLVIEGVKEIAVNSERQSVIVRGVCRPQDLTPANQIGTDRLAQLEVRINGKGVVGDAIRRPFFLYRLLQGILPF